MRFFRRIPGGPGRCPKGPGARRDAPFCSGRAPIRGGQRAGGRLAGRAPRRAARARRAGAEVTTDERTAAREAGRPAGRGARVVGLGVAARARAARDVAADPSAHLSPLRRRARGSLVRGDRGFRGADALARAQRPRWCRSMISARFVAGRKALRATRCSSRSTTAAAARSPRRCRSCATSGVPAVAFVSAGLVGAGAVAADHAEAYATWDDLATLRDGAHRDRIARLRSPLARRA